MTEWLRIIFRDRPQRVVSTADLVRDMIVLNMVIVFVMALLLFGYGLIMADVFVFADRVIRAATPQPIIVQSPPQPIYIYPSPQEP